MALLYAALLCLPAPTHALELAFPNAAELVSSTAPTDGHHPIATGPWTDTGLPTRDALGVVQEFTWQITGDEITTFSLLANLQDQIEAQGFSALFTCFADTCGGFDFRHALPVGNTPEMYVDLGDFQYLSAVSDDGETQAALMISRGGATGFVHLALIQPLSEVPSEVPSPVIQSTRTPGLETTAGDAILPGGLIERLTTTGAAPLDDLQFETGASDLSGDSYGSLIALAAFLAEDASRRVVLVGHTDALGSLSGNIALSRVRAQAVRQYLIQELGTASAQVDAEGIGFLSPRESNTTPEGREANRRVEVVLANP